MKKLSLILLLAAVLQSCKYTCQDATEEKGMWKIMTFARAQNDSTTHISDILIFGPDKAYRTNNKCEILQNGQKIAKILSTRKDKISGNKYISVYYNKGSIAEYIAK